MDVEVAEEEGACVVWCEFCKFCFECVECLEWVRGWSVEESEEKWACVSVNCKPKSFCCWGFADGGCRDGVGASVDDDASVIRGMSAWDVVRSISS